MITENTINTEKGQVIRKNHFSIKPKFMSLKNMNLDSASKKAGTSTSTPKGPQRTILKPVRILPWTVETSESNSLDDQLLYPSATQEKRQANIAASSS